MDETFSRYECPRCKELEKIIEDLRRQIAVLEARCAKLERENKRQAAPFRKPKKKNPKKPGRKPGPLYGEHKRPEPPPQINECHVAPLPETCPECGGQELTQTETVKQYQIEIPREVIYRQFDIEVGVCCGCGCRVQGRHSLQTSNAIGAAAVQWGPSLHAAMAIANKELGLSHGKTKRLFKMLHKIDISRSSSCRSVLRTGKRLETTYEDIRNEIRKSAVVVPDETGWRVGGEASWLHVFATSDATLYVIDPTRSAEPCNEVLGADWNGILVRDGWSVYDQLRDATHQQCLAHLMRRCQGLLDTCNGMGLIFLERIQRLFQHGFELRRRYQEGAATAHGLKVMAGRLTNSLLELVFPVRVQPEQERFAKFIYKHIDSIFTFLRHPEADATNWRAEQAIRPAVVNRKVWGGNRTDPGADAQERIMSVIRSCAQRLFDPFDYLRNTLTSIQPIPLPKPLGR